MKCEQNHAKLDCSAPDQVEPN